jgi:hypothetical protein
VIRSDNGDEGRLAPRIDEFRRDDVPTIRRFQQLVADMSLFGMMVDKTPRRLRPGLPGRPLTPGVQGPVEPRLRALDTDTSAEGTEWIPTGIGASLHEKVRAPARSPRCSPGRPPDEPLEVANRRCGRDRVPRRRADLGHRIEGDRLDPRHRSPRRSTPRSSAPASCSRSPRGRLGTRDPALHEAQARPAFVDAEEKAILDGDTDGTHQDSDTQSAGATTCRPRGTGSARRPSPRPSPRRRRRPRRRTCSSSARRWASGASTPMDLAFIVGVSATTPC